jgi:outer membrane receptor for ferric coprogen and ferric-rhodotorulic acid
MCPNPFVRRHQTSALTRMKHPTKLRTRYLIAAQLCALAFGLNQALAQSAPTVDAATLAKYDKNHNGILDPDEIAAMNADQKKDVPDSSKSDKDVVALSPFEVVSDTKGYYSANTMSGTRFNSKLDDLASSVTVVTKEQMNDFAMLDINDVFNYTANTEGTGTYTDFSINRNGDANDNVMANPTNANRVRGVASANYAFNNIQTMGRVPVDPIGIDSIEVSRGPNANIFGLGNPSGTINMVPSGANVTRDLTEVTARGDSYDGYRGSLDVNRVLVKGVLAVRGQAVFQHDAFQRKPSGVNTERYNGLIKYQPFKKTTITAGLSYYDSYGNRPNFVPPRDFVSYWIASGRPTWDPIAQVVHVNGQTLGPFTTSTTAYAGPSYFQTNPAQGFSQQAQAYIDQNGLAYWAAPTGFSNTVPLAGASTAGPTSGGQKYLLGTAPSANETLGRSTTQPLFTTTPSVSDKGIYDYSSINLGAMNRTHTRTLTSSLQIDQLFFNTPRQTLAGQAGFLREDSQQMQRNIVGTTNGIGQSSQLFVDVNEKNLDGTPNPFLGRAYIGAEIPVTTQTPAKWDTYRAQLGYKIDLSHEKNLLHWLGLTQFSAYDEYKYRINRTYAFKDVMTGDVPWIPPGMSRANQSAVAGGQAAALNITRNYFRYYVGGNNGVVDNAPGTFAYGSYPFVWGNTTTGVFHNDPINLEQAASSDQTGGGSNTKVILKTLGGVAQSHFLDDKLVTTFGLREDQQYTKAGSTPQLLNSDGTTLNYDSVNHWAAGDYKFNSGKTTTAGAVVRPLRDLSFLRKMDDTAGAPHFMANLLRGMSFTYNKSDSFLPANFATDLYLKPLPVPTGTGRDFGVSFSMLDNKIVLRWNHYDNLSINSRQGDAPTIAQRVTRIDITSTATFLLFTQAGSANLTTAATINGVAQPQQIGWVRALHPEFTEQQVEDELGREMGIPYPTMLAIQAGFNAGTITATQDTKAKGNEIELNFNPTANWTVSANWSETESITSNVASSINDWINMRMPIWTTIVDPRYNTPWWTTLYGGTQTPQANYIQFVQTPFAVTQQKEGKANPQIGKYSAKLSTNYRLAGITENHILKNINIGGAIRWQSAVAIDYYGAQQLPAIITSLDVNKPIYQVAQYHFDLLAGYRTRLFNDRIPTRFQFNVTDVQYAHTKLLPIDAFPDGTPSAYRIVDPRKFVFSMTFDL